MIDQRHRPVQLFPVEQRRGQIRQRVGKAQQLRLRSCDIDLVTKHGLCAGGIDRECNGRTGDGERTNNARFLNFHRTCRCLDTTNLQLVRQFKLTVERKRRLNRKIIRAEELRGEIQGIVADG